jgi:hypothetical protein
MAEFDLSKSTWRFHHSLGVAHPPSAMDPAGPNGPNTDVVLGFTVADPALSFAAPPPAAGALQSAQGTWYRGYVAAPEDAWDTDAQLGRVWVRVIPATHDAFHLILLIQEGFALPATPAVNGELPVRIYTGRYTVPGEYFAGYGADNWAGSGGLFTFTLTPEQAS